MKQPRHLYALLGILALTLCLLPDALCLRAAELWQTLPQDKTKAVHDFAGIIQASDEKAMEKLASNVWDEHSASIVVVTIDSLQGGEIDDFTNRLFEKWGIGGSKYDQGVLFLVAKNDRKMRIEVGYGLEGTITDAQAKALITNVATPAFRNGNYSNGIRQVVTKLDRLIQGDPTIQQELKKAPPAKKKKSKGIDIEGLFIFLIFAIYIIKGIINVSTGRPFFTSTRHHGGYYGGSSWGGGGGFSGGGFGGFGGGSSGGGGASGGW